MLKKGFLSLSLIFIVFCAYAQIDTSRYNFNFLKSENNLPKGWYQVGEKAYNFELTQIKGDSVVLSIQNKSNPNDEEGVLMFDLPDNFAGKRLLFQADIKTKGIDSAGSAGLFVHVFPKIDFKKLEEVDIPKNSDWNNYGLAVNLSPKETKKVTLGLYLVGKGQVYFKNLQVKIDDQDYSKGTTFATVVGKDSIYNDRSHVDSLELTDVSIKRLQASAQIWGLLKYFHPEVAKGKWDMDTELFKFFPKIVADQSEREFEEDLLSWIAQFGNFNKSQITPADSSGEIRLKADFSWIEKLPYSKQLKDRLHDLVLAERNSTNPYFDYFEGVSNVRITEMKYAGVANSDLGYRLLGLFRYWNIIQYFYPYRYLTDGAWDTQLKDFIPLFTEANTVKKLDAAYLLLFSKIRDTHAFANLSDYYHRDVFGKRNIEFRTKLIENELIVTALGADSLGTETEIRVGDIIKSVNGIQVSEKIKSIRPLIAASNAAVELRDMPSRIMQSDSEILTLAVERNHQPMNFSIPSKSYDEIKPIKDNNAPFEFIRDSLLYIHLGILTESDTIALNNAISKSKGLIIDFRHYPKLNVHRILSKQLFSKEKEFARFSSNQGFIPGEFRFTYHSSVGQDSPALYKHKVVVLINEDTQSAAEFQVMALKQSPNVVVLGSTTAGADGNISWVNLPFGYSTAFSAIGVYYPDKGETQGIGIIPDIEVKLTLKDIQTAKDPYMLKALELFSPN